MLGNHGWLIAYSIPSAYFLSGFITPSLLPYWATLAGAQDSAGLVFHFLCRHWPNPTNCPSLPSLFHFPSVYSKTCFLAFGPHFPCQVEFFQAFLQTSWDGRSITLPLLCSKLVDDFPSRRRKVQPPHGENRATVVWPWLTSPNLLPRHATNFCSILPLNLTRWLF